MVPGRAKVSFSSWTLRSNISAIWSIETLIPVRQRRFFPFRPDFGSSFRPQLVFGQILIGPFARVPLGISKSRVCLKTGVPTFECLPGSARRSKTHRILDLINPDDQRAAMPATVRSIFKILFCSPLVSLRIDRIYKLQFFGQEFLIIVYRFTKSRQFC